MRLLFVALALPYPPTSGHRMRIWFVLRTLVAQGHDLTLISFRQPEEPTEPAVPLQRLCKHVELVTAPHRGTGLGSLLGRAWAQMTRVPYGVWRFKSWQMRSRIQELWQGKSFEALLCDGVYNMANIPHGIHPVILNKDDVAHVLIRRYGMVERNLFKRAYARREGTQLRGWEEWACGRADAVLVSSAVDGGILRSLCPGSHLEIVPNVVDTMAYSPESDGEPDTIVYSGGMDWHPNRDAVSFFAEHVLTHVRQVVPTVVFRVVGRIPAGGLGGLERRRGFVLAGDVTDMRGELARAAVFVVPLRIASGTRLKILEAAAMGKAIVSTRVGVEGLNFTPGEELFVADDPKAFAGRVVELLRDPALRRRMGSAARTRVEKEYSLPILEETLRGAITRIGGLAEAARARSADTPPLRSAAAAVPPNGTVPSHVGLGE